MMLSSDQAGRFPALVLAAEGDNANSRNSLQSHGPSRAADVFTRMHKIASSANQWMLLDGDIC
jgi:hypothetical protein